MNATELTTADGLTIYDLSQQAGELVAVAGPAGYTGTIDPDALPAGFRWISEEEWSEADQRRAEAYVSEASISPERASRLVVTARCVAGRPERTRRAAHRRAVAELERMGVK